MINLNLIYSRNENKNEISGTIHFYFLRYISIITSKETLKTLLKNSGLTCYIFLDKITIGTDESHVYTPNEIDKFLYSKIEIVDLIDNSFPRLEFKGKILEGNIPSLKYILQNKNYILIADHNSFSDSNFKVFLRVIS